MEFLIFTSMSMLCQYLVIDHNPRSSFLRITAFFFSFPSHSRTAMRHRPKPRGRVPIGSQRSNMNSSVVLSMSVGCSPSCHRAYRHKTDSRRRFSSDYLSRKLSEAYCSNGVRKYSITRRLSVLISTVTAMPGHHH